MTRVALALCLLLAATVSAIAGPPAAPRLAPPAPVARHQDEAAAKRAALERAKVLESWVPPLAPLTWDAIRYSVDLRLDLEREAISGTVAVELEALVDGLATVGLDADLGLRVTSVLLLSDPALPHDGPRPLAFTHRDNRLEVDLPRPLSSGERVWLLVAYGGHGQSSYSYWTYGVNWDRHGEAGAPVVWSMAEPYGARVWWPCQDRTDDKALVDLTVTAPAELLVSSNGAQVSRVDNGDGTATTHWASAYPIATYLVVMNASDFAHSEQTYVAGDGSTMPVALFAYPELAAQAELDLANTPEMIGVLAAAFGEYPFLGEKYGNCLAPFGGGMEHQTLTSFGAGLVGTTSAEWINIHELGHSWWGDWVTCGDWKDLWLNEGFATYAEQVWAEHRGADVLADYVAGSDWVGYFRGPLYDNPEPFSDTVYTKGGWILRMLRHVLGDDAFFAALADYRAAHGGAGATTAQLQAVLEESVGSDLDWFFEPWVYGTTRPRYQYDWQEVAGPAVRLRVRQLQTNAPLLRMPLDVRVTTSAGSEDHLVWVEAEAEQTIDLPLSSTPTAVALDPDHQVLAEIGPASAPDLDFGPLGPDGFDAGTLVMGSSATLQVPLVNLGGSDLEVSLVQPYYELGFELLSPQPPFTVAAGASQDLTIRFRPRSVGFAAQPFVVLSNDPSHDGIGVFVVTGSALAWPTAYIFVSTQVEFGPQPVGTARVLPFTVANRGGTDLLLSGGLTGEAFALLGAIPDRLAPGEEVELGVRFLPTAPGAAAGTVTLTTNDPYVPSPVISLSGEGLAAPRLELDPPALLFGSAAGATSSTLVVSNTGSADLVLSDLRTAPPFDLPAPPDLPLTLAPGSSVPVEVRFTPADSGESRGSLRLLTDDPVAAWVSVPLAGSSTTSQPVLAAVPAVAHSPGIGGATWSTTLVLLNPTGADLDLDLGLLPADLAAPDLCLSVPAGQQRWVEDVVASMGRDGTGGLELAADSAGLVASTVTATAAASGTHGQQISAVARERALDCDAPVLLPGLAAGDGFHTNFGLLNLADEELTVTLALHAASGAELGTLTLRAAGRGFAQASDALAGLSPEPLRGAFAVGSCAAAGAAYHLYASVVDDASHDPSFVAPLAAGGSAPLDVVLPAVASTPGLGGTQWRSDLVLVATGTSSAQVTLELHPRGEVAAATATVDVPAGTASVLEDVVGTTLGRVGSGWLRLTSAAPGLLVASRTYNDDPAGTYGQEVAAVDRADMVGPGERVVLPGLTSAAGFRTNLGVASAAAVDTAVTVRARRDDGEVIGEVELAVPAGALLQVDRFLSERLGHVGPAWVELWSDDAGAAFFAYASVVDEGTGDPVLVPGTVVDP